VGVLSSRLVLGAFAARVPQAHSRRAGRARSTRATAYGYARALADASPRVELFTIGRSEEGRDIVLLAIADEKGIQSLEQLKRDTAALADPRTTDQAAAEQIVERARPIYYFNAACTRTKRARPNRCWSWRIASRCRIRR
jgi:hypothetical protein